MVKSNINPDVQYVEKRTIDPEDKGHESSMYVIEAYDIEILIVLGNPKYTFSGKGIVYYPIYIVSGNKIKSQIGVFEAKLSNNIRLVDEDGDIDIDKLEEPILYSFVTKKYIQSANSNPHDYFVGKEDKKEDKAEEKRSVEENKKPEGEDKTDKEREVIEVSEDEGNEEDEDDILLIKVPKNKVSSEKEKTDKEIDNGIFIIDPHFRQPETFVEETEKDSDEIRKKYRESASNLWIEKFMKNNNYGIVDNEGGGDCFFAIVRDAYEYIGRRTTVSKLRALVASQVDLNKFENDRKLYLEFDARKTEIKNNMRGLKETIDEYGKRVKRLNKQSPPKKEEIEQLVAAAKELANKYDIEKKELRQTEKDQTDYAGYMENIDTLDKYREFMKTSNYWADGWAIATLEALLKVKFVIFSEEAYKNGFNDGVLNCGAISSLLENKQFDPEYYILTSYSGNHYRLITYKNKRIFNYKEIPYNVKILIVNKCLEKNSGIYYKIQDFRNFKSLLGLNPDEGAEDELEEDDERSLHGDLYNESAVFVFHEKSLASAKPGMGTGESIDASRRGDFTALGKIPNWRRKLSDSWMESPFRVDNHMWASVEHYVQATRFKKGFPEFYEKFSLDSGSDLSKDVSKAKEYSDARKHKESKVKEDVDYKLGRDVEERIKSLRAKYSQSAELTRMLCSSRDAILKKYVRRRAAIKDVILMKIRKELMCEWNSYDKNV